MIAWIFTLGMAAAAPNMMDPLTVEEKSDSSHHQSAHERFQQGQKNAALGLKLWGGSVLVGTAGAALFIEGAMSFGAPVWKLNVGAAALYVAVAGAAGGPILGGLGLHRSSTALESLGVDVDPALRRVFWGAYGTQFITAGITAIAVPILLAVERRKLKKLYEDVE